MLSYQHIYHAGNRADLHKHAILAELLQQLTQNSAPITYIETHAGRGLYDLTSPEARKTGEAQEGVLTMLQAPTLPAAHPYLQALRATHAAKGQTIYPGSPAIAHHLLRPTDQLHLFELHPQEVFHLRRNLKGPNLRVHQADGYDGTLALDIPASHQKIVLIDPSFEIKSEYQLVVNFMIELHRYQPDACLMLWYPMLKANLHQPMIEDLLARAWHVTHHPHQWADPQAVRGLYGSGMVLVNAPQRGQ